MKLYSEKNKVIAKGMQDFDPKHVFECGQCFRWDREEDGSYTGIAHSRILNVKKEDDMVIFDNTTVEEFEKIWVDYFDLERDYSIIKERLKRYDEHLEASVEFGGGIRLLRQDVWEMIVSFIISANNAIPKIKKTIERLSKAGGESIGIYRGVEYYSFPDVKNIYSLQQEEIENCKAGYRAKYIKDSCGMIARGDVEIQKLKAMDAKESRNELLRLSGVGPKVADCIMLFGLQKYEAFPVDVWVKRVMEHFYVEEEMSLKKMRDYAVDKFGDLSGFAQQYLFYYARENGIGRKK